MTRFEGGMRLLSRMALRTAEPSLPVGLVRASMLSVLSESLFFF